MSHSTFFAQTPKELVTCLLAKQVLTKGGMIAAVLMLNNFFPSIADRLNTFSSIRPLWHYLRPSQLVVEAAVLGFNYVLLHSLNGKVPIDSGRYPTLAHLALFNDSCGQYFVPKRWRWLLTFVVLDDSVIAELINGITPTEERAFTAVQMMRWAFSWTCSIVEKKVTDTTPLKWKTIAVFLTNDILAPSPLRQLQTDPSSAQQDVVHPRAVHGECAVGIHHCVHVGRDGCGYR